MYGKDKPGSPKLGSTPSQGKSLGTSPLEKTHRRGSVFKNLASIVASSSSSSRSASPSPVSMSRKNSEYIPPTKSQIEVIGQYGGEEFPKDKFRKKKPLSEEEQKQSDANIQQDFANQRLAQEGGLEHLYAGTAAYEKKHGALINDYKNKYPSGNVEVQPGDEAKFFRIQFAAYMEKLNFLNTTEEQRDYEQYCKDNNIDNSPKRLAECRKAHPDNENAAMQMMLSPQGLEKYLAAVEKTKAYQKYLVYCEKVKRPNPSPADFLEVRRLNPEEMTVPMEEMLRMEGEEGEKGLELYKKALEEEANSKEYMNAVFYTATQQCDGPPWNKRPIIIIGGPSSSGKTTAAGFVFKFISRFIPRLPGPEGQNYSMGIDGGDGRAASQIRKLAIQGANNQGFSGNRDLEHYSKPILDCVKDRFTSLAFNIKSKLGIIIPDTFVGDYVSIHYLGKFNVLDKIKSLGDSVFPIHCRVDGEVENSALFEKVVSFLGSARSWMSDFGGQVMKSFDLNRKDKEDKPRNKAGYKYGQKAGKENEDQFMQMFPGAPCLGALNDAIFLKRQPGSPPGYQVLDGSIPNCIVVSRSEYNDWISLKNPGIDIEGFSKNNQVHKIPDPANPNAWIDSKDKNAQGVVAVKVQTWELWNNLSNPKSVSLQDFIENKTLYKKKNKSGAWVDAMPKEEGALEVSAQLFARWKDSDKKIDLPAYINNTQKLKTIYEFKIVQLKNELTVLVEEINDKLKKMKEVFIKERKYDSQVSGEFKAKKAVFDALIEQINKTNFNDPKDIALLRDFIKTQRNELIKMGVKDEVIEAKFIELEKLITSHGKLKEKMNLYLSGAHVAPEAVTSEEQHQSRFPALDKKIGEMLPYSHDEDLNEELSVAYGDFLKLMDDVGEDNHLLKQAVEFKVKDIVNNCHNEYEIITALKGVTDWVNDNRRLSGTQSAQPVDMKAYKDQLPRESVVSAPEIEAEHGEQVDDESQAEFKQI